VTGIGFTAPWLLAAAAALAVPLLAHLARHEDRAGRGFPSLMFLRRVPFPARARHRLEDRALLALRLLALLALVLAFAGAHPLYEDGAAAPRPQRDTVVLLDVSYSMGLGDRFESARAAARAAIGEAGPGERVALVAFDDAPRLLAGLDGGAAAAQRALEAAAPGHRGTDLARALEAASALLAGSRAAARRVVLAGDLQASGLGADPRLPRDLALDIRAAGGALAGNLSLAGAWREADPDGGARERVRVRVANSGGREMESRLRMRVDGLDAGEETLRLARGESVELALPVFPHPERATRISVHLDGDALAADNQRFLVLAPRRTLRALLAVGAESAPFLEAALSLARDPALALERVAPAALDAASLEGMDLAIVDAPAAGGALAEGVRRGMGLLAFGAGGEGLEAVTGVRAGARVEVPAGTAMAAAAPRHALSPALAPSVGPVWRYLRLEPGDGAQVLARFDDGAPALVVGAPAPGRSLLLATSPAARWSAIARRPEFAPLLIESVTWLAGLRPLPTAHPPGAVLDVAALAGAVQGGEALAAALRAGQPLQVRTPSGHTLRPAAGAPITLEEPGFYELRAGGSAPLPVAVSVDAREAALASLPADALRARIRRTAAGDAASGIAGAAPPPEPDERLARALLLAGVVLLLAEGLLAALLARRRAPRVPAREPAQEAPA